MASPSLKIQPLEESTLKDVVHIHKSVLGYTFSSQLGSEHLAYLYRQLSCNRECYTAVALISGQPVGIISGSIDMNKTKKMLVNSLPLNLRLNTLFHLIKTPPLIIELWRNRVIDRPIFVDEVPVNAILTTIAIQADYQGLQIGKQLVKELENFFLDHGVENYRVDTYASNIQARNFYKATGFHEVATRTNSVVLIKGIQR